MKKFIFGVGAFVCARFIIGVIVGFTVGILNAAYGAGIDITTWPSWLFIFIG
jgi:hypothetical protein